MPERTVPLFKQGRHRCDYCGTIFDCAPCPHRGRRGRAAADIPRFCSADCEAKQKAEAAGPSHGSAFSPIQNKIKRRAGGRIPGRRSF